MKTKKKTPKPSKSSPLDSANWVSESSVQAFGVQLAPDQSGSGSGGSGNTLTIAGPDRIGYVQEDGAAKEQTYTVTASSNAEAQTVKLEKIVDISEPTVDEAKVTYRVKGTGTSSSARQNDITLKATSSTGSASKQISVVVPKKYAKEGSINDVVPTGQYMTEYTTPSFIPTDAEKASGIWCKVRADWGVTDTVTVHDQYNQDLGNLYDGAEVTETDKDGNSVIIAHLNKDNFGDRCSLGTVFDFSPQDEYPAEAWIREHTPDNRPLSDTLAQQAYTLLVARGGDSGDGNMQQKIDRISMEPMTGRTFYVSDPVTFEITWEEL
jgi:hypothetical protein